MGELKKNRKSPSRQPSGSGKGRGNMMNILWRRADSYHQVDIFKEWKKQEKLMFEGIGSRDGQRGKPQDGSEERTITMKN